MKFTHYLLLVLLLVLLFAAFGCSSIVGNTPTMQHCSKVDYHRDGNKISISAECAAPIGSSGLPIPLPGSI